MPGGDGTGPMGRGAMTGRGMGVCTGASVSGYGAGLGSGNKKGMRSGLGVGYGCRRGFDKFVAIVKWENLEEA